MALIHISDSGQWFLEAQASLDHCNNLQELELQYDQIRQQLQFTTVDEDVRQVFKD